MFNKFLTKMLSNNQNDYNYVIPVNDEIDLHSSKLINKINEYNNTVVNKPISQSINKKQSEETLYCLFATSGNTVSIFQNKEKIDIKLKDINYSDSKSNISKKAMFFLNELIKKTKVYYAVDNNEYTLYLEKSKKQSINEMLIEKNLHTDEISTNTDNIKIINKKSVDFCYGIFAVNCHEFIGMHENKKKTFKLSDINFSDINSNDAKKAKSIIYDNISKKNVYLDILNTEKDPNEVIVFLDEEKKISLNQMIKDKFFKTINNTNDSDELIYDDSSHNEQGTEEDWGNLSNFEEIVIPKMFANVKPSSGKLSFGFKKTESSENANIKPIEKKKLSFGKK